MDNNTIAAISTPAGLGGIAVIRISGHDAINISDKVFKGKSKLIDSPSHTVHYGFIISALGEKIDEVLVTLMKAPRTYTREDVVEISTHGGMIASKRVLERLLEEGAYLAEPGEFTKRAFLNGRIDLSQAEAVIDIINSKTSLAQKNAMSQSGGSLSYEINRVRDELIGLCASMQVLIDYPDEDLEDITAEDILLSVTEQHKHIASLLKTSENGKIIKDGIKTVIAGKPNVGKSSLLNMLAREERAIVTDIAGTTRDVIEESVNIDGVPLILTDTAGIRKTDDTVEKIGVEKSMQSIENADLIIIVLDAGTMPDAEEISLLENTRDKKRIIIINKTDIKNQAAVDEMKKYFSDIPIEMSAITGEGSQLLNDRIKELYNLGKIGQSDNITVTNIRHVNALKKASESLFSAKEALISGLESDIVSIDISNAVDSLGEITGAVVSEDIVNAIFHQFCVGK